MGRRTIDIDIVLPRRRASDAFEESKHPRQGGKFVAKGRGGNDVEVHSTSVQTGTTHKVTGPNPAQPKEVKAEKHEIHHNGKHLGTIHTYTGTEIKKSVGMRGGGTQKTVLRWSAQPTKKNGEEHTPRSSMEYKNKADAVGHLLRHHGIG